MDAMKRVPGFRIGLRLALATAAAALLAGCSDATRFSSDPFSNPFASNESRRVDHNPVGTIAPRQRIDEAHIRSQPLAPPPGATIQPAPIVTPQPRIEPVASSASGAGRTFAAAHGTWSAEGGTPIVVAQGESVAVLSERYGVPKDALLSTNGFSSAGQVQPGARIVIPIYRNGAMAARSHEAAVEPPRAPVARAPERRETYHLVKGPDPAKIGKSRKLAKSDEDEQPKAHAATKAEKLHEEKRGKLRDEKAERSEKEKHAKSSEIEHKAEKSKRIAKSEEDERPARMEKVKPVPQHKAELEPAARPQPHGEVRKIQIDRQPTASLPPAAAPAQEQKSASAVAASPEFRWPARGRIIQGFRSGGNDGINIAVPEGTAVKAAEDGVVKYAGNELKGYGNLILIQHPNGFVSAYANNSELDVKRGDTVKRGQTIAKAGQTGNVTTPQVHFELRKGSTPVDPTGYLAGL